ncbi:MAG: MFS transporter [Coxiella sp. RIFCSPHIGHO2_12_FULL_44_14]|nr:MAG: MFS transporter [Coxiella sp. RIFCSPHIGHO2_12_FULL_44_14]
MIEKVKFTSKSLLSWFLFDWANSAFPTVITTFVFATYFTEKIAVNHIVGTSLWGDAMSIAAIVIAITSPIFGAIADVSGKRKIWLAFFAVLTIISSAWLWKIKPNHSYVYLALFYVVLGEIGMEVGAVFYNAMLNDLVPEKQTGRASGIGWGIGYFGGLVALSLILFVFLNKNMNFLGLPEDQQVRIVGPFIAIWYAIFAIPLFVFTKQPAKPTISLWVAVKTGLSSLRSTLKSTLRYRNTFSFIIARMIYIDGLNTVFAFGGIYAAGVFHLNMDQVIIFGISTNVSAGIGAISLGWVDDWIGSKATILISLVVMIASALVVVLSQSYFIFWIFGLILCFCVGSVQSASRSMMLRLAPKEIITEMFGFYALSGRITAFVGPWLLGFVTLMFNSQRVGMSTVILFFIFGGILLLFVKEKRDQH